MAGHEDVDGAGDWTVAGLHTAYSDREWAEVKATFKPRWWKPKPYFIDRNEPGKRFSLYARIVSTLVDGR